MSGTRLPALPVFPPLPQPNHPRTCELLQMAKLIAQANFSPPVNIFIYICRFLFFCTGETVEHAVVLFSLQESMSICRGGRANSKTGIVCFVIYLFLYGRSSRVRNKQRP